jgi:hypothetical protein
MKRLALLYSFVGLAVLSAPLAAQKPREKGDDIPREHRPPPGLCRIWIDNVPPAQQPAPTDCSTAVRNRPANGRVIFGDDYTKREGKGKKVKDVNRLVPPSNDDAEPRVERNLRTVRDDARYDRQNRPLALGRYDRVRKRPSSR